MKKLKFSMFILLIGLSSLLVAESSNKERIVRSFKLCVENGFLKDAKIKFGNYVDLIKPEEISYVKGSIFQKQYSNENSLYNIYTAKIDIDNDSVDELVVLQHSGSGRFPTFYILKFDRGINKYKVIIEQDDDLYPFSDGQNVFFYKTIRDYDSGRYYDYDILSLNGTMAFEKILTIKKSYTYDLDKPILKYINEDQINRIANQDYSFIGITETKPDKILFTVADYQIEGYFWYSNVGYFASNIKSLTIKNLTGQITELKDVWGFSIKEINNEIYLTVLDMDPGNPVSTIEDFRITASDIRTGKVIVQKSIKCSHLFVVE